MKRWKKERQEKTRKMSECDGHTVAFLQVELNWLMTAVAAKEQTCSARP